MVKAREKRAIWCLIASSLLDYQNKIRMKRESENSLYSLSKMRMERSIHHCPNHRHRCWRRWWWWWWRHRPNDCNDEARIARLSDSHKENEEKITLCNICSLCPTTTVVFFVVNVDAFVCQKNAAVFIAHLCALKMLHQHFQLNKQSTSAPCPSHT